MHRMVRIFPIIALIVRSGNTDDSPRSSPPVTFRKRDVPEGPKWVFRDAVFPLFEARFSGF